MEKPYSLEKKQEFSPFVPQFHQLLQPTNIYAQKDLKELQEMLKESDDKLERDLQELAANYKDDRRIIRGILQQRSGKN